MRSPLALVEVSRHDPRTGANTREWVVVRTAVAARGQWAHRVIFIRNPTLGEREVVEACLDRDNQGSCVLSDVLEAAWKYGELCK